MTVIANKLHNVFAVGETVAVEFKRCGSGVGTDTYETVCAFLNRYGGDIYLGVDNDGTVVGVPANSAPSIVKNIINAANNPDIISPTTYLAPDILTYNGKCIVRIHVPPSSEVHTYKKVVYDRADDADVKVKATGQIAAMYIRKQNVFTEKKIFPYVKDKDLRFDMLPRIKQLAINRNINHPWKALTDKQLILSAKLYGEDKATGEKGYNLAAIMLLGRDEVIQSVSPTYRTDALLRKVNLRRYDDRLLVETNLIDSYELLMGFAEKYLPDKFYLEDDARISIRNAIAREMLVNTLIHREFTSPYIAKFVIERDRMFTENASRATTCGLITPDDFQPTPKNPIIAAFFRNIGFADDLGSGVRNLFYYGKRYSGKDPQLVEGDVFRIVVPLDDEYLFETEDQDQENVTVNLGNDPVNLEDVTVKSGNVTVNLENVVDNDLDSVSNVVDNPQNVVDNDPNSDSDVVDKVQNVVDNATGLSDKQRHLAIIGLIEDDAEISSSKLAEILNVNLRTIQRDMQRLKDNGKIERVGPDFGGYWKIL